jgi:hypothetical protein
LISNGIKRHRKELPEDFGFRTDIKGSEIDNEEFVVKEGEINKDALNPQSLKNVQFIQLQEIQEETTKRINWDYEEYPILDQHDI